MAAYENPGVDNYDTTSPKDPPAPTPAPRPGPTAVQQGMTPVPGHPGLYFNSAGVIFNEAGSQVDGYYNQKTGTFQTGTPVTNPTTGIIEPPTAPAPGPPLPPGPPAPPPPTYQPPTNGSPTAPTFTPPPVYHNDGTPVTSYTAPPKFDYAQFIAPDPNKLNDDPLFRFTMAREQDAISKRAAAAGGLFTGGTYDALMRNAADISSAGYQRMYDRDAQAYTMNRGNAAENYRTNYDTTFRDPYQFAYKGAQDAYDSQIHSFDTGRSYDWARTLFGADQDEKAFDRKYRIFSAL